jgi:hypothetical protein
MKLFVRSRDVKSSSSGQFGGAGAVAQGPFFPCRCLALGRQERGWLEIGAKPHSSSLTPLVALGSTRELPSPVSNGPTMAQHAISAFPKAVILNGDYLE